MNAKTIAGWAVTALVVWFVIQNPPAAAHVIQSIGNVVSAGISGLAHFVASI